MSHLQRQVDRWIEEQKKKNTSLTKLLKKVTPQSQIDENVKRYLNASKKPL